MVLNQIPLPPELAKKAGGPLVLALLAFLVGTSLAAGGALGVAGVGLVALLGLAAVMPADWGRRLPGYGRLAVEVPVIPGEAAES